MCWSENNCFFRGAFSIVYLATQRASGQQYAVKVINKKDLGKDYEKNLKMEVDILKKVNHPNIIALKELFDTPDKLYLIMELYVSLIILYFVFLFYYFFVILSSFSFG